MFPVSVVLKQLRYGLLVVLYHVSQGTIRSGQQFGWLELATWVWRG